MSTWLSMARSFPAVRIAGASGAVHAVHAVHAIHAAAAAGVLFLAALPAQAGDYVVTIRGVVGFNVIAGALTPVPDGTPVVMSFQVDSATFLNSASFPTRGYNIELNTLSLNAGGVSVPIVNPQPNGSTAYFVLRNNDPAVDGFFMSRDAEVPVPLSVNIPGLAPVHELNFSLSYSVGTVLNSLDIAEAVGTDGMQNLDSLTWSLGRFGNSGAEFDPASINISAVPEPASWALFVLGGLAALRLAARRRAVV